VRNILLFIVLLITVTFSQTAVKCGFQDIHNLNELTRATRPDNQEQYLSAMGIFYVHYDTSAVEFYDHTPLPGDDNQNDIPDYVEWVAIMADSTYHMLVDILGYDAHPPDEDGIYDIYLRDDLNPGWYGVTYYNTTLDNGSSFIVIDNDFSPEEEFYTTGYEAMKVTVVHEFFHGIQFGYSAYTSYQGYSNVWFYEMSSTWLEDVSVPEVNDYLSLRFNFFNDPTKSIDDTNGYSIALYAHYLATVVEGVSDEFESDILREIWTNFSHAYHHKSITSMESIINVNYDQLFIDTWLDWVTRNLYNNIYEEYYYYEDQALIGPIVTNPISLNYSSSFQNLQVDKYSAGIKSYRVIHPNVRLELQLDGVYYTGYVAIVSSEPSENMIYQAVDLMETETLSAGDEVHFILGNTSTNNGSVNGEIRLYFTPNSPENVTGYAVQDSVKLLWNSVNGPGVILNYLVEREWVSGEYDPEPTTSFFVYDTLFFDSTVIPGSTYSYTIVARNSSGYSGNSAPVVITAWPDPGDVSALRIVSLYPNPVSRKSGLPVFIEIDSDHDYPALDLQAFNILGQRVFNQKLPPLTQGRHRINLTGINDDQLSSGMYFIRIRYNNNKIAEKKIHLLK